MKKRRSWLLGGVLGVIAFLVILAINKLFPGTADGFIEAYSIFIKDISSMALINNCLLIAQSFILGTLIGQIIYNIFFAFKEKKQKLKLNAFILLLVVVLLWRGVWMLLDIYFYPDNPLASAWACIIMALFLILFPRSIEIEHISK
jgi:hypothetical protein